MTTPESMSMELPTSYSGANIGGRNSRFSQNSYFDVEKKMQELKRKKEEYFSQGFQDKQTDNTLPKSILTNQSHRESFENFQSEPQPAHIHMIANAHKAHQS